MRFGLGRRVLALGACLVAAPVLAGPYDGVYRPDAPFADDWDCETVGQMGGALAVRDLYFWGVENQCTLTNPVEVRDMPATLYDAICSGEGTTDEGRIMLMTTPEGLAVLRDGSVALLRRCGS